MTRSIVVGGGVAGLVSALLLSRAGQRVDVLEGDAMPLPATPLEAFRSWERRGAPQVWHSHAFLARVRELLLERCPDVVEALLRHGAEELHFRDWDLSTLLVNEPHPDDERIVLLACRRITFEWVLRSIVEASPGVTWHDGARVTGLIAERDAATGLPRVTGVRARRGRGPEEALSADHVVDASGRRSRLAQWLAEAGARPVTHEQEPCGIFYCSRFYRLRPGREAPPTQGPLVGVDLGYMKYAVFPGDSGIFSLTLAAPPEDAPFRAILRTEPFETAVRSLPLARPWIDPDRAEPITPVRGMGGLRNVWRHFVTDGEPVALGVHAVGDAAVHTNPIYGRGCTLAAVHASLLVDAMEAHPEDPAGLALAFDAATRRELGPWYRAASTQDRDAREIAEAQRRGETFDAQPANAPGQVVDPKAFMRSVIKDGLFPALRTDGFVLRAFMRTFNLLAPPEELMSNPAVLGRILEAWRNREHRAALTEEHGPPRLEMVELLEKAA